MESEEEAFRRPKPEVLPEQKPLIEYSETNLEPEATFVETSFFVREITLEGQTPLAPESVRKILSEYENRTLTLAELREAARLLTAAIRSKGYITSRVYVPPQKIQEGKVTLKVLEGKLGKIS